jgi:hypothetical protein
MGRHGREGGIGDEMTVVFSTEAVELGRSLARMYGLGSKIMMAVETLIT